MPDPLRITVMTVTYNGMEFLERFFQSLLATDQQGVELDILLIDNGSSDATVQWVKANHPRVRVLENDQNNYTRAVNLGIAKSVGEYFVITNNDATVHPDWLQGFLQVIQSDEKIGAVQSKLYFSETNRINSVGVQETGHFYFADIGFDTEDSPRYDKPREREYLTGGSVMFRRTCLEDVGEWDEDFIMFMEDVDYSARCRKRGWKLWFSPSSILYHQYHGNSSPELCEYFCTRNRFFFIAKHFPLELVDSIRTSHFYQKGEIDNVFRSLLHSVQKMCACHDAYTVNQVLQELKNRLPEFLGDVATQIFFSQLEVLMGLRKIRVGIYSHAGHFPTSGQRYVAEMIALMEERYEVSFVIDGRFDLGKYEEQFDLDLTSLSVKIIEMPLLEECEQSTAEDGRKFREMTNPFDMLLRETLNYDIFVNASELYELNPLSPVSVFIDHSSDEERTRFFWTDEYDQLIINGECAGEWSKSESSSHSVFKEQFEVLLAQAELQLRGHEMLPYSGTPAAA